MTVEKKALKEMPPAAASSRHLRGIIFDMDGVLIDSHTAHRKAWRQFLHALGREVADSELDFILDGRKRGDILRHFLGDCPDADIEKFGRRKDCIFQQMQLEVAPIRGAIQMVQELYRQGFSLAVATSASSSRALSTLSQLKLLDHFQVIVTGEDVPLGKPDPSIYRAARARMAIQPEHLIAMEDAISGVRAAVGAGLCCVGLATHELPKELLAAGATQVMQDFESASVDQLERILLQWNRDPLCSRAELPFDRP
jgi:HAD superfamily hydrolase (TIGR01509 family)